VIINTSFNVRGEPIVLSPDDAYLCFMRTNMDVLVLGNQILLKEEQPELHEDFDWRERFALDWTRRHSRKDPGDNKWRVLPGARWRSSANSGPS